MDEKLIYAVQQYPCIYERRGTKNFNISSRKHAWKNIASYVGINEVLCRTRWRTMRDRFFKEIRTQGPKNLDYSKIKWKWFPALTFLLKPSVYRQKRKVPNQTAAVISEQPENGTPEEETGEREEDINEYCQSNMVTTVMDPLKYEVIIKTENSSSSYDGEITDHDASYIRDEENMQNLQNETRLMENLRSTYVGEFQNMAEEFRNLLDALEKQRLPEIPQVDENFIRASVLLMQELPTETKRRLQNNLLQAILKERTNT